MDPLSFLLLLVIGMGVFFFTVGKRWFTAFSKGSLSVETTRKNYASGETIGGTVRIQAKKAFTIEKLTVTLIGYIRYQKETGENGPDGKPKTERTVVTIWSDAQDVPCESSLSENQSVQHDFQLRVPSRAECSEELQTLGETQPVRWRLEGRVHIEGFDLIKNRLLSIELT